MGEPVKDMFKFSGVRVLGEGRLHTLWSRDSSWARERGNEGKTGRAGGQRSWWKEVSVGSTGLTVQSKEEELVGGAICGRGHGGRSRA